MLPLPSLPMANNQETKMGEKLTLAQLLALEVAATRRPVAGNDEGWVGLHDQRRPSIHALERLGLIEGRLKGAHTTGSQTYRITPAGRAALDQNGGEHGG